MRYPVDSGVLMSETTNQLSVRRQSADWTYEGFFSVGALFLDWLRMTSSVVVLLEWV